MPLIQGKQIASGTITATQVDSATVGTLAGTQTFSGDKTFTGDVIVPTVPATATSAVNKTYVDNVAAGLTWKQAARVATTANLSATRTSNVLTENSNGALIIDGVTMAINDRVLVKNQSTGADNGIYYVSAIGDGSNPYTLTRSSDADNSPVGEVVAGIAVFITEGSANSDSGYVLTTDNPITLNTTALVFTQFSGGATYTWRDGLLATGNIIDVNTDNSTLTIAGGIGSGGAVKVKTAGITANELATDSVTTVKIQNAAVTNSKLATNSVDTSNIIAAAVTTAKIANANITNALMATDSVGTSNIIAANVTLAKMASDSVDENKIVSTTFSATGAILGGSGTKLSVNVDGTSIDINTNAIEIKTAGVTTAKIADLNVTTAKLADDAVTTSKILDANVTTAKLADAAVTTLKIADANVTLAKLSSLSVDETKLTASVAGAGLAGGAGAALSVNTDRGLTVVSDNVGIDLATLSGLSVAAGTGAQLAVVANNSSIAVLAGGLKAATPATSNKTQTPAVTSGNDFDTTLTIASTPSAGSYVQVLVNGLAYRVGNGTNTGCDCYFGAVSGTAHTFANIVAADKFFWNGTIAGFQLAATDVVDFDYVVIQ